MSQHLYLENRTPPPHPTPYGWSKMGDGLVVTTSFGEQDPHPPTDKRHGGGLRTAVALALLLVW